MSKEITIDFTGLIDDSPTFIRDMVVHTKKCTKKLENCAICRKIVEFLDLQNEIKNDIDRILTNEVE